MSSNKEDQKIVSDISSCANNICNYPEGLRILAIDDNPVCLEILSRLLKKCGYQVTTITGTIEAYETLKNNKDSYDLVLTDVNNNMDCFKFAEFVTTELNIPVIFMSADDRKETLMNCFKHGAQYYLLKPVRYNELKIIWQHVVRKKQLQLKNLSPDTTTQNSITLRQMESNDDQEGKKQAKEKKKALPKKQRFSWTKEMFTKFLIAIEELGGIENAVPKKILEMMNDPTITREIVASRLQKHRINLGKEKDRTKATLQEYEQATQSNTLSCGMNQGVTSLSYQNRSVQPTYTNAFGSDIPQATMLPQNTFQFRPPMCNQSGNTIGNNSIMSNIAASSYHQNQHFGPTQEMNGMRLHSVYPRPIKTDNNYPEPFSFFPGSYNHSRAPIPIFPQPINSMLIRQPSSYGPIQTRSTHISQPTNSLPVVPPSSSNRQLQREDSLDFSFEKIEQIMNNPNWDPLCLGQTSFNPELECDFAFNPSEDDVAAIFNNNSDPSSCS